jgi:hypothetical protein
MSDREKAKFAMEAELRFREPASVDELEQAQIQGMYARAGIVTINEARRFMGLPALPDEFVYGQLPLPMGLALLELGLMYQGAVTSDGVLSWDETLENMINTEAAKAAAEGGMPPEEGGEGQQQPPAQPQKTRRTRESLEKLRSMSGFAWRLKDYLKQSMGRDVLSAELILQDKKNGEVIDRIALGDLGDEEGSDE